VVRLRPEVAPFLRQFFEMLSSILQRNDHTWPDTMPFGLMAETAFNNVWFALSLAQQDASAFSAPPRSIERQAQVVKHAVRFMQVHLADEISMADICAATHVSQRTLQYYFENCLQTSPQQYLKALRLNVARRMLRQQMDDVRQGTRQPTIADIAAACGYGHASRFAGEFKRQFGELPSEAAMHASQPAIAHCG
jgi:AraC family ethanolamine operon transcriptional activator